MARYIACARSAAGSRNITVGPSFMVKNGGSVLPYDNGATVVVYRDLWAPTKNFGTVLDPFSRAPSQDGAFKTADQYNQRRHNTS